MIQFSAMVSVKPHGRLFVISGPSGVGKGTIIQEIIKHHPGFVLSISHCSRAPRSGEKNGIDYCFVSREEFKEMILKEKFLEYAEVHGNYYGTAAEKIEELIKSGKNVIFEVDVQGGISLKKILPEVTTIFIRPPNTAELVNRINKRGSETPETLARRLETMKSELAQAKFYDYQVVNDKLSDTLREVLEIMNKEGKKHERTSN